MLTLAMVCLVQGSGAADWVSSIAGISPCLEQHSRCNRGCCAKGEGAELPQTPQSEYPWQGQGWLWECSEQQFN